jgi:hypothetical protein
MGPSANLARSEGLARRARRPPLDKDAAASPSSQGAAIAGFTLTFAPGWDPEAGMPDAMLYVLWSKLERDASEDWPQSKRLGVDSLRWVRNPPAGELLRGRMTVLAKDPVGEDKGIVIAQHDLLDEAGRLVFSCMQRSIFACRGED